MLPWPSLRLIGARRFTRFLLVCAGALFSPAVSSLSGELFAQGKLEAPHLLRGHSAQIGALALSHDSKVLASGDRKGTQIVWDLATGKPLAVWKAHDLRVLSLSFNPDGTVLASGGSDDVIGIWDPPTGRTIARLAAEQDIVFSVAFSPDGRTLASGGADGTIQLWDSRTHRRRSTLKADDGRVCHLAFSPDGGKLLAGCNTIDRDGRTVTSRVKLWDLQSGKLRFTLPDVDPTSLAFFPDGDTVATAGAEEGVTLWAASTGKQRDRFENPWALWFAFASDGRTVVSTATGDLTRWDFRERSQTILDRSAVMYNAVAVSSDGSVLVAACSEVNRQNRCAIKVWHLRRDRQRVRP
jgi:WD40 repeat protein